MRTFLPALAACGLVACASGAPVAGADSSVHDVAMNDAPAAEASLIDVATERSDDTSRDAPSSDAVAPDAADAPAVDALASDALIVRDASADAREGSVANACHDTGVSDELVTSLAAGGVFPAPRWGTIPIGHYILGSRMVFGAWDSARRAIAIDVAGAGAMVTLTVHESVPMATPSSIVSTFVVDSSVPSMRLTCRYPSSPDVGGSLIELGFGWSVTSTGFDLHRQDRGASNGVVESFARVSGGT